MALAYDTGGRKSTESLTIAGQTYTTDEILTDEEFFGELADM